MICLNEQFVHGGNVYETPPGKDTWIDFSANINPLGLPQRIRQTLVDNIEAIVHYPDPTGAELKQAIAKRYDILWEEIVLGNGAAELLYVFFHTFHPKKVLLPVPSFSEYERSARSAGLCVEYLFLSPEKNFSLVWEEIFARLPQVDCLVLGNPNNPTGELLSCESIENLLREAEKYSVWILVDESFIDFREDAACYTVGGLTKKYPKLVILHSLTKFYAIPGLRLGFGIMRPAIVQKMDMGKDPWNVNLLAQKAGVAALSDQAYRQDTWREILQETGFLLSELKQFSTLCVYMPTVNFLFMDLFHTGFLAADFTEQMKQRGILIRDCSNYPGLEATYIRIAVRTHAENEKLIEAFKNILGDK